ncbi:BatD family protein [Sandarakinorhabdus sp.]|uniref:BatD family protein n=1 Tax=Sandarakinorhabdus sp. TaxID=1916663 RepID=UPI003F71967D
MASLAAAPPPPPPAPPPSPPAPDDVVTGAFQLPKRQPWAGEVFSLGFAWQVDWDLFRYLEGDLGWKADPLVIEGWTRLPLGTPYPQAGRTRADLSFTTRAIALAAGSIALPPPTQQMQIVTGSYETSGVTIANIGAVAATGGAGRLTVRALPPPPAGFGGAVGDFTLQSAVDKTTGETGKPITWTVRLSGTGNWMGFGGIPSRPLQRDFDVLGAPRRSNDASDSLFERTVSEAITIVPRRPGRFALGPVEMTVFDPRAGKYRTVSAPAIEMTIAPGAAGSVAPGYDPDPTPPPADDRLPGPLAGIGDASPPLPRWAWTAGLALPGVLLSLLWLGLAIHRALVTDPHRPSRRAHARLIRTLHALAAAADARGQRQLLRHWQRDAGTRLQLGHAAPTPAMIPDSDWAELWHEADRCLYGPDVPLPPDWHARASAALALAGEPPPFRPVRILTAARLAPVVLLLCLAGLHVAAGAAAPSPAPTKVAPRDWIAHYTLARTAAAAGQWDIAAAHAGIAWVQNPRSAETTSLWKLVAQESGVGGRARGGLPVPDTLRGNLAGLLPPLGWQRLAIVAALCATGGFGLLLLQRFGHAHRVRRLLAGVAGGMGVLGMAVGVAGQQEYGAASAPDAAIIVRQAALRPLPVATPDSETIWVLPPGTAAHMDAGFMGWVAVRTPDGRSGWLRREELVPIWQPAP